MDAFQGTLKVHDDRGIIYFIDGDGTCVLRIEGLPDLKRFMDEGKQIDIRLVESLERQDDYRDRADVKEGVIRAVRVPAVHAGRG